MISTKDYKDVVKIPTGEGFMKSCTVDKENNYLYFCKSKGDIVWYNLKEKISKIFFSDKSKNFDMLTICPNNKKLAVNDNKNNLLFF